jgi:predicted DNA-binding transcriptional regulator AlpA
VSWKEISSLPQSKYVSIAYLVSFLNLSKSSIRRLELAGRFPARKVLSSRRVGYDFEEILNWCTEREKA